MVEGVRVSKQQLLSRFRLGQRLAVRIGALLAKGVETTAALLESAPQGSPMEALLLHPRLLEQAGALGTELVNELGAEFSSSSTALPPLAVVRTQAGAVLALEEELLAEQAWGEEPSSGPEEPSQALSRKATATSSSLPEALARLLPPEEAQDLFTQEQVSRLKLRLLTSVDPAEKIRALRELMYAPMDPREKGTLLLKALADESTQVRSEAASALHLMQLRPEVAETVRTLFSPNLKEKTLGIQQLSGLAEKAEQVEQTILLAALLTELRCAEAPGVLNQLCRGLEALAPAIVQDHEFCRHLTGQLLKVLQLRFDETAEAIRTLYARLTAESPEEMIGLVWEEMEKVQDRRLKAYLLIILGRMKLKRARRTSLAELMAQVLLEWTDSELEAWRLGNALVLLGKEALPACLKALEEGTELQRELFVRLLDELLSKPGMPRTQLRNAARQTLQVYKKARRPLRLTILETRIFSHPDISKELRRDTARELLSSIHEYQLDRAVDLTETAIRRLGTAAIGPLLEMIQKGVHEADRKAACKILGELCRSQPQLDREVRQAFETCRQLIKAGHELIAELVRCIGKISVIPGFPEEEIQRLGEEFQQQVGRTSYTCELLEALGWIGSGASAPIGMAMRSALLLIEYLDTGLPEVLATEHQTEEGTLLKISHATTAYTELIPTAVQALGNICSNNRLTDTFHEKTIKNLLEKWKELVAYRLIWGPANTIVLAETLGRIATLEHIQTHLKADIVEAVASRIANLSIVQIIGETLKHEVRSNRIVQACAGAVERILELCGHRDYQEFTDREILLRALGKIASRKRLAPEAQAQDMLRRKVIAALTDGVRDEVPGARDALSQLASCENFPATLRREIRGRLSV